MTLQAKLSQIGTTLATVTTKCYHYWRPVKDVPCIIWAEDGEDSAAYANNIKTEQAVSGTVDYFTKKEFDAAIDTIQTKLNDLGLAWVLNSVQYEDDTALIHYSWNWSIANGQVSE